mgnify:CR=1 FL=1
MPSPIIDARDSDISQILFQRYDKEKEDCGEIGDNQKDLGAGRQTRHGS